MGVALIDPVEAAFRLAVTAFREGRVPQAEGQLRKVLAQVPGHVEAHLLLGILLVNTNRPAEAVDHLQAVVTKVPTRDEALYWSALAKRNLGDPAAAASLCERALAVNPKNPIVLNELGFCRMTMNQAELAEKAFGAAIRLEPRKGVYHFNHGLALARLDRIYKARTAFEETIRLDPRLVEAYLELAHILEILNARDEVLTVLKKGVEAHPAEFQLQTALASATALAGDQATAEEIFRRVMAANPVSGNSYGLWLQQEGRFGESVDCFLTSIRAQPAQGLPYYGLAEAKAFEIEGVSWIEQAEQFVESPELDLKGKTYLSYALARAYERRREAHKTITYFDLANDSAFKLYNEGRPFKREELKGLTDQTIAKYPTSAFDKGQEGASESDCPIFIVGMIRSGTTLLDQVISSHPMVSSAGESVFWMREADRVRRLREPSLSSSQVQELANGYLRAIESVAGPSPRITDKMPLNYAHLGLIHQVFPNAKIIHLRRSPLDTCFSIYTTFLGQGPNFAYSQSNIVFNYLEYLRLMEHWRKVMPGSALLEEDYESLVTNREDSTRKIVEFCGLEWDDACLHHERNDSSIRTPSKWQARQPVYNSSIQRWKPYEPWLGALLELRDLAVTGA